MNDRFILTRRRFVSCVPGAALLVPAMGAFAPRSAAAQRYAPSWSSRGIVRLTAAPYAATGLKDVPDGVYDHVVDINEKGVMIGWSGTKQEGVEVAVIWHDPERAETLATIGGNAAEATHINDAGHAVGGAEDADGNARPVLWADGKVIDLGTLGGLNGFATAINNREQIVGYAENRDGGVQAFLWQDSHMQSLAEFTGKLRVPGLSDKQLDQLLKLGGRSEAADINEKGEIVGYAGLPGLVSHAVRWHDGEMTDRGTLGGDTSEAKAINESGHITGWSRLAPRDPSSTERSDERGHAFLWQQGNMTDLGAPADGGWSAGADINAHDIIAMSGGTTSEETRALIWNDGTFVTLDEAEGAAYGLNDAGIVVGTRGGEDGQRGMMWTPTGVAPSAKTGTVNYRGIPASGQTLGQANAPVTLTEYADYQCRHCKRFVDEHHASLIEDYVRSGKVKLVFHDIPFIGGQNTDNDSFRAAEASRCAMNQGKFWPYHDTLFAHQGQENAGAFSRARVIGFAVDLGLDVSTFTRALDGRAHEQEVVRSRDEALAAGITRVPSFAINDALPAPSAGYDALVQEIERALGT